jgi:hypothetical protein
MKSPTTGVAMTEPKQKIEPKLSTGFRKIVTGGSLDSVSHRWNRVTLRGNIGEGQTMYLGGSLSIWTY